MPLFKKVLKRQKPTIIRFSKIDYITQQTTKIFYPGLLHSKIIDGFIKICLPKYFTFNAQNAQCGQPLLGHCRPSFIFYSFQF